MAKVVSTICFDDLDGSSNAQAISFALYDQNYVIDLTPENAQRLAQVLAPFLAHARPVRPPRPAAFPFVPLAKVRQEEAGAARAWASKEGIPMPHKGIPVSLLTYYRALHPNAREMRSLGAPQGAPQGQS